MLRSDTFVSLFETIDVFEEGVYNPVITSWPENVSS